MKQVSEAIDDVMKSVDQAKLDRIAKMRIAREQLAPLVNRANDKEVKDRGREKALNRALGIVQGLFLAGLISKGEENDWRHWCDGYLHQPELEDEVQPPESPAFDDVVPF